MLAVLEEGCQRFVEDLATADIAGETLTERIESYYTISARYYAHPEYLAFVQVLLNLRHDPRTSEQTLETMSKIGEPVATERKRLEKELFAAFRGAKSNCSWDGFPSASWACPKRGDAWHAAVRARTSDQGPFGPTSTHGGGVEPVHRK